MAMATLEDDPGGMSIQLVQHSATLKAMASRCDTMCLTAGVQLGNAVPGLYELSNQFASLSAMLVDQDGTSPADSLEAVADDIMSIGTALSSEKEAVAALITINGVLSQRIIGLAEHVRFLAAVVSNVKIEIASIDEGELRLDGFADNLKQLARKSEATVSAFQDTHQKLIDQLRRTSTAQSAFVSSHGTKFKTASKEISASLGAVSERRKAVSDIAGEIGAITQRIGARIAECVVALQVGDSARQRLEHAGEGLSIAADILSRTDPDPLVADEPLDDAQGYRDRIAGLICALETRQTTEAVHEFSGEVRTIAKLIGQITEASLALNEKSRSLVSSPQDGSRPFLADLESKLAFAGSLIDECGKSRRLVDDTAEQVITSVAELQELAKNVAAMATDMMIIGTNAVVTSYRLGTKGIPLSVIAQHLRSHAVHVTDAVKLVRPALDKVRDAAREFTTARKGQDAMSMGGLALRIAEALAAFQAGDKAVAEVHDRLEAEVVVAGNGLGQASDALHGVDEIDAELADLAKAIHYLAADTRGTDDDQLLPPSLDQMIRKHYTMGSERVIHDSVFAVAGSSVVYEPQPVAEASLWL